MNFLKENIDGSCLQFHLIIVNNRDFRDEVCRRHLALTLTDTQWNQKSIHSSTLWAWLLSAKETRYHQEQCLLFVSRITSQNHAAIVINQPQDCQWDLAGLVGSGNKEMTTEWDQHKCTYVAADILINRPKMVVIVKVIVVALPQCVKTLQSCLIWPLASSQKHWTTSVQDKKNLLPFLLKHEQRCITSAIKHMSKILRQRAPPPFCQFETYFKKYLT